MYQRQPPRKQSGPSYSEYKAWKASQAQAKKAFEARKKKSGGCLVILIVFLIIVGFGAVAFSNGGLASSGASPTKAHQPLVMPETVQPDQAELLAPSPTITPVPPTSTPEPEYRATEHFAIMQMNAQAATDEAQIRKQKANLELQILGDKATATAQAYARAVGWENDRATQRAEVEAEIAEADLSASQAKAQEAISGLAHNQAMNEIEEDEYQAKLQAKNAREEKAFLAGAIFLGLFTFGMMVVFFRAVWLNTGQPHQAKPVKVAPLKPYSQKPWEKWAITEKDYYQVMRVLQSTITSDGGKYANSVKMPRFDLLDNISSEVRSKAANTLKDLGLVTIHETGSEVMGTFFRNHMTATQMYNLFAETKTVKSSPAPTQAFTSNWGVAADQAPRSGLFSQRGGVDNPDEKKG